MTPVHRRRVDPGAISGTSPKCFAGECRTILTAAPTMSTHCWVPQLNFDHSFDPLFCFRLRSSTIIIIGRFHIFHRPDIPLSTYMAQSSTLPDSRSISGSSSSTTTDLFFILQDRRLSYSSGGSVFSHLAVRLALDSILFSIPWPSYVFGLGSTCVVRMSRCCFVFPRSKLCSLSYLVGLTVLCQLAFGSSLRFLCRGFASA